MLFEMKLFRFSVVATNMYSKLNYDQFLLHSRTTELKIGERLVLKDTFCSPIENL